MPRFAFISAAILALAACSSGSSTGTTGGTTGASVPTITFSDNMMVSPATLIVPAGATITVINNDSQSDDHTATAQAVAGDFVEGAADGGFDFNSHLIKFGATATINVPAGLPSGTVQPWFCAVHKEKMMPPNPIIQIQ